MFCIIITNEVDRMAGSKKKTGYTLKKSLVILGVAIAAAVGVIFFALKSVYFNVDKITVKNNLYITTEEVTAFADVKGENIFLMDKSRIIEKIKNNPYIDRVEIERKLPNEIVINITEKNICAIAEYSGSYVNIDSMGRMVQVVNEFPNGELPLIVGVNVDEYLPGQPLIKDNKIQMEALKKCLTIKNYEGMAEILKAIDISDPGNIVLKTNKNIDIIIGDWEDMDYRLSFAISVMNNSQLEGKTGSIEVYEDGKAVFRPNN
jgi:cell division protein FtsQ